MSMSCALSCITLSFLIILPLCGGNCFASLTSLIRKVTNLLHDKWITEVPFVGCIWAKWFWVSVIHNYYNNKLKAYIIGALHGHNYIGSEPNPKQLLRPILGILNGFYQELWRNVMLCIYTGPSSTLRTLAMKPDLNIQLWNPLRHITLKPSFFFEKTLMHSCAFIFVNLYVATKPTPELTLSAHEAQEYSELRQFFHQPLHIERNTQQSSELSWWWGPFWAMAISYYEAHRILGSLSVEAHLPFIYLRRKRQSLDHAIHHRGASLSWT
jgi:hypothetical protein